MCNPLYFSAVHWWLFGNLPIFVSSSIYPWAGRDVKTWWWINYLHPNDKNVTQSHSSITFVFLYTYDFSISEWAWWWHNTWSHYVPTPLHTNSMMGYWFHSSTIWCRYNCMDIYILYIVSFFRHIRSVFLPCLNKTIVSKWWRQTQILNWVKVEWTDVERVLL